MTNRELCNKWAMGQVFNGSASNKTLIVEDGKIYSYGKHFLAAQFLDNGTAQVNSRKYSSTTSKHCSYIRSALASAGVTFEVVAL